MESEGEQTQFFLLYEPSSKLGSFDRLDEFLTTQKKHYSILHRILPFLVIMQTMLLSKDLHPLQIVGESLVPRIITIKPQTT